MSEILVLNVIALTNVASSSASTSMPPTPMMVGNIFLLIITSSHMHQSVPFLLPMLV